MLQEKIERKDNMPLKEFNLVAALPLTASFLCYVTIREKEILSKLPNGNQTQGIEKMCLKKTKINFLFNPENFFVL